MKKVTWRGAARPIGMAGLLFLCSALAGAIEIDVRYHNSIDLAACRTWSWAKGKPAESFEVERALRGEIESQLRKKGAERVEEGAGCLVATAAQREIVVPAGTLVIEIYDTASERVAWSAVAAAVFTDDDPKKVQKIARKAVREAFKRFPEL